MSGGPAPDGPGPVRLEAFSDGVIAIIVTIMVLELKVPKELTPGTLLALAPVAASYALSFLVVAIMWVNHHGLLHHVSVASPRLLWANLHLLFWMSLIPFATWALGESHGKPLGAALYGVVLALCVVAFSLLRREASVQAAHPELASHHAAVQRKNVWAVAGYLAGAALAPVSVAASCVLFTAIPLAYFVPRRP